MAPSHRKRARTVDRDRAVDLLNSAFADGRLTAAEREDRVARALDAKLLGELDQVMSDLKPEVVPAPAVRDQGWWQRNSRRTKLAIGAAFLVVVGGGVALAALSDDDTVIDAQGSSYVVSVELDAIEELVAAQEAEFATTKSYGLNLQQQMTTVKVPTDDGAARYRPWRPVGDGGFEPTGPVRGAGDQREFDLADVDLAALGDNLTTARTSLGVPEPAHLVLVIVHWTHEDEPRIAITTTNDYDESGYLVTDLGGEIIERHTFAAGG